MTSLRLIRMTATLSSTLFRYAPSVHAALYDRYEGRSERGNIALIQRCVQAGHRVVDIQGRRVGARAVVGAGAVVIAWRQCRWVPGGSGSAESSPPLHARPHVAKSDDRERPNLSGYGSIAVMTAWSEPNS
jgi:hypothetical protein